MNESRVALGKRVQSLRQKAGLTQEELAEKADISIKRLGEIERGRGNPTFSSIEGLAESLEISPSVLLQFEDERPSIAEIKTEIQHMLDVASDEECRKVYRLLRDLLS